MQAGRYAVGLDPVTLSGGPDTPGTSTPVAAGRSGPSAEEDSETRTLRVLPGILTSNSPGSVTVELQAEGNESALGFSLNFDPAVLSYSGSTLGAGATGATLNVNTNLAVSGQLGFALSRQPIGSVFGPGNHELLNLPFQVSATTNDSVTVDFGNVPVLKETSDALANSLPTVYQAGVLSIEPLLLTLQVSSEGERVTVFWDTAGTSLTNLLLQENVSLEIGPTTWSNVPPEWLIITNGHHSVTLTNEGPRKYFRLVEP